MSDRPPILSVHNLRKVYLERPILEDVTFTIHEGERVALLGANGAGKSTLMSILVGTLKPESGEVRFRRGLEVSYLDQEGGLNDEWTVKQTIDGAFTHVHDLQAELEKIHDALEHETEEKAVETMLNRMSDIEHELEKREVHTMESRRAEAMQALGVPEPHRLIGQLSGGERRRTALCRTLLELPDLLMLDEPTNHLDAETLDWLEDFLARYTGTVVFVTHDRYFLDSVATRMMELNRGQAKSYEGNYTDYLLAKEEESTVAAKGEAARQNMLRRELDWLRKQPRARTVKSKSRVDRANELLAKNPPEPDPLLRLMIPTGPRLGSTIIEAEKISVVVNGRTLVSNFNFIMGAKDRIGIVGRNGLGKTTLLRILMKQQEPQTGEVKHGNAVRFVYGDQQRKSLDLEKTVLEEVTGELEAVQVGESRIGFRAWLRAFLFDETTAAMPIKLLSGGERNRVQLAKMLREGGNIVVLDEPTNDLDLPTLRVLEESLATFEGCAFIVSHDRYFLNRVATKIFAFRGDGRVEIIVGNYDDYRRHVEKQAKGLTPGGPVAVVAKQPAVAEPAKANAAAGGTATATKTKLTNKEQRELETIEARIQETEGRVRKAEEILVDPKTFAAGSKVDGVKVHRDLDVLRKEVETLYARWEDLSQRAK